MTMTESKFMGVRGKLREVDGKIVTQWSATCFSRQLKKVIKCGNNFPREKDAARARDRMMVRLCGPEIPLRELNFPHHLPKHVAKIEAERVKVEQSKRELRKELNRQTRKELEELKKLKEPQTYETEFGGVVLHQRTGMYLAQIDVFVGKFETAEEANEARRQAIIDLYKNLDREQA